MLLPGTQCETEKDWNSGSGSSPFPVPFLADSASADFEGSDLPHAIASFKPHGYGTGA